MINRIRLSFICAVFMSFYLYDQLYAKRLTESIKPVQNISIEAVQQDGKYTQSSNGYKFLKLNVSWLPSNNNNKRPSSYSIIITGVPDKKHATTTECPEGLIFYKTNNDKQFSVLLPESNGLADIPDLPIQPGCSYEVQVIANPSPERTINRSQVLYTVPECIGNICSCSNAKSMLPIPKVNVMRTEHQLIVNWSASSDASNVSFYLVRIGVPLRTSRKGLPIYNMTQIGQVPAEKTMFLKNLRFTDQNTIIKDGYKVIVNAVNDRGCFVREGSFVINTTLSNVKTNIANHNIGFTIYGLISGCVLFGVVSLTLCYKYNCFVFHNRTDTRIRTISKCKKSHWTEAILQTHNIIYGLYGSEEEYKEEIDELQIPFKSIELIRELGTGQFGKVHLGYLNDKNNTLVAVKISQEISPSTNELEMQQQFMNEIEIMRKAGTHPNLVNLLGYCIQPNGSICILLEYMQGGDLLTYLHTFKKKVQHEKGIRNNQEVLESLLVTNISETSYTTICPNVLEKNNTNNKIGQYMNVINNSMKGIKSRKQHKIGEMEEYQFLKFAIGISMGMEHLELKGITHRDLAARNILLGSDLTVKISDFGLSRNGIYMIKNIEEKSRRLPIRWMSPEAIRDRTFSSKSDVWSYGIVLWEISTLGAFPYSNVQDDRLLRYIIHENGRLEQPDDVPSSIYKIMCSCWTENPEDRPNFTQLLSELKTLIGSLDSFRSIANPSYALPFSNENM